MTADTYDLVVWSAESILENPEAKLLLSAPDGMVLLLNSSRSYIQKLSQAVDSAQIAKGQVLAAVRVAKPA